MPNSTSSSSPSSGGEPLDEGKDRIVEGGGPGGVHAGLSAITPARRPSNRPRVSISSMRFMHNPQHVSVSDQGQLIGVAQPRPSTEDTTEPQPIPPTGSSSRLGVAPVSDPGMMTGAIQEEDEEEEELEELRVVTAMETDGISSSSSATAAAAGGGVAAPATGDTVQPLTPGRRSWRRQGKPSTDLTASTPGSSTPTTGQDPSKPPTPPPKPQLTKPGCQHHLPKCSQHQHPHADGCPFKAGRSAREKLQSGIRRLQNVQRFQSALTRAAAESKKKGGEGSSSSTDASAAPSAEEKVVWSDRLVDYFLVYGVRQLRPPIQEEPSHGTSLQEVHQERLELAHKILRRPSEDILKPELLGRYPEMDYSRMAVDDAWVSLTFPDGVSVSPVERTLQFHSAVLTLVSGLRLHAFMLTFDAPLIWGALPSNDTTLYSEVDPENFVSGDSSSSDAGSSSSSSSALSAASSSGETGGGPTTRSRSPSVSRRMQRKSSRASQSPEEQQRVRPLLYASRVICLVSHYPHFELMRQCLMSLYTRSCLKPGQNIILNAADGPTLVNTGLPVERFIAQMISELPSPEAGRWIVGWKSPLGEPLTASLPAIRHPLSSSIPTWILFSRLSVDQIMFLVNCMLQERRILLHSQSLAVLGSSAQVLLQLLSPLQWEYVFIPVLPLAALDCYLSQSPYIMGCHSEHIRLMDVRELAGIAIVDLDNRVITCSSEAEANRLADAAQGKQTGASPSAGGKTEDKSHLPLAMPPLHAKALRAALQNAVNWCNSQAESAVQLPWRSQFHHQFLQAYCSTPDSKSGGRNSSPFSSSAGGHDGGGIRSKGFPSSPTSGLTVNQRFDRLVYRAFLRFYAAILSGFRHFIFFIDSKPYFDTQAFLERKRVAEDAEFVRFCQSHNKKRNMAQIERRRVRLIRRHRRKTHGLEVGDPMSRSMSVSSRSVSRVSSSGGAGGWSGGGSQLRLQRESSTSRNSTSSLNGHHPAGCGAYSQSHLQQQQQHGDGQQQTQSSGRSTATGHGSDAPIFPSNRSRGFWGGAKSPPKSAPEPSSGSSSSKSPSKSRFSFRFSRRKKSSRDSSTASTPSSAAAAAAAPSSASSSSSGASGHRSTAPPHQSGIPRSPTLHQHHQQQQQQQAIAGGQQSASQPSSPNRSFFKGLYPAGKASGGSGQHPGDPESSSGRREAPQSPSSPMSASGSTAELLAAAGRTQEALAAKELEEQLAIKQRIIKPQPIPDPRNCDCCGCVHARNEAGTASPTCSCDTVPPTGCPVCRKILEDYNTGVRNRSEYPSDRLGVLHLSSEEEEDSEDSWDESDDEELRKLDEMEEEEDDLETAWNHSQRPFYDALVRSSSFHGLLTDQLYSSILCDYIMTGDEKLLVEIERRQQAWKSVVNGNWSVPGLLQDTEPKIFRFRPPYTILPEDHTDEAYQEAVLAAQIQYDKFMESLTHTRKSRARSASKAAGSGEGLDSARPDAGLFEQHMEVGVFTVRGLEDSPNPPSLPEKSLTLLDALEPSSFARSDTPLRPFLFTAGPPIRRNLLPNSVTPGGETTVSPSSPSSPSARQQQRQQQEEGQEEAQRPEFVFKTRLPSSGVGQSRRSWGQFSTAGATQVSGAQRKGAGGFADQFSSDVEIIGSHLADAFRPQEQEDSRGSLLAGLVERIKSRRVRERQLRRLRKSKHGASCCCCRIHLDSLLLTTTAVGAPAAAGSNGLSPAVSMSNLQQQSSSLSSSSTSSGGGSGGNGDSGSGGRKRSTQSNSPNRNRSEAAEAKRLEEREQRRARHDQLQILFERYTVRAWVAWQICQRPVQHIADMQDTWMSRPVFRWVLEIIVELLQACRKHRDFRTAALVRQAAGHIYLNPKYQSFGAKLTAVKDAPEYLQLSLWEKPEFWTTALKVELRHALLELQRKEDEELAAAAPSAPNSPTASPRLGARDCSVRAQTKLMRQRRRAAIKRLLHIEQHLPSVLDQASGNSSDEALPPEAKADSFSDQDEDFVETPFEEDEEDEVEDEEMGLGGSPRNSESSVLLDTRSPPTHRRYLSAEEKLQDEQNVTRLILDTPAIKETVEQWTLRAAQDLIAAQVSLDLISPILMSACRPYLPASEYQTVNKAVNNMVSVQKMLNEMSN